MKLCVKDLDPQNWLPGSESAKICRSQGQKISQRRQTKIILLSTPKSELLNLTEIIKMLLPSEYASIRFSLNNKMTKKEEK